MKEMSQQGVSRRSFLKSTAALGGALAVGGGLAGCSVEEAQEAEEEKVYQTLCYTCHGCALDAHVRNNNVVEITPTHIKSETDLDRFCARGAAIPYHLVSPKRIKYPMKRTTWSPNNPQGEQRGRDEWERISWDEAIEIIGSQITKIQGAYGKDSFCIFQYGAVESRFLWNINRLQAVGGFSDQARTTDMALAQSLMYGAGTFCLVSGGNDQEMLQGLKCLVVWGHNPCVSWLNSWHYIADAVEWNNCKIIVIEPNFNTIAAKADKFVSIRPGSDGALALGMVKYIEDAGLSNDAYMKTNSCAPFLVKENGMFLRRSDLEDGVASDDYAVWDESTDSLSFSQIAVSPALRVKDKVLENGMKVSTSYSLLIDSVADYSLERVEEITGVSVDDVKEIVAMMVDNMPAEIMEGYGLDHWTTGFNNMQAVVAVRIQLGLIQAPDTNYSLNQTGFAASETVHPYKGATLSTFMFNDLIDKGECTLGDKWNTTVKVPLHGLLAFGGNLVNSCPDQNDTIKAYKKLDFIAAVNFEWGDTTSMADIVLPASMNPESHDIEAIGQCVVYAEQAITPKFEAKSDFEICQLIGRAIGLGEWFTEDLETAMQHTLDNGVLAYYKGITYEQLKEEKCIYTGKMPLPVYMTATYKPQFYLESMYPFTYFNHCLDMSEDHLPHWEPPVEGWKDDVPGYPKNELANKYPFHVILGTRRFRNHSTYGQNPVLREMELNEPEVRINPDDGRALGIDDGDYVLLYNDRGHAVMRAQYHAGIRPREIDAARGWMREQYKSGCAQELTMKTITNWNCPNYAYHDALCNMVKWDGTVYSALNGDVLADYKAAGEAAEKSFAVKGSTSSAQTNN